MSERARGDPSIFNTKVAGAPPHSSGARRNRFPHQAGLIGSPSTMVEGKPSGSTGTSPMRVTR